MSESTTDQHRAEPVVRGYELLEQVGTGAFAVVWRARQTSVDREVAVKQIRSELASQPAFIRRFEAEAHLVARLQHPHIVPLVDFWRGPDSALLVMQYLRGGTLERRLDDGPLTEADTLRFMSQVGAALEAAHDRQIVHRDVKTANVLFDEHGNAYLSDFGIALDPVLADSAAAALSPGTPLYAPPEQLRRERVGPAADIFSLGVVAYECLAGSLPFAESSTGPELFHRQLHEPLPDLHGEHGIDASLAAAVARATEKDPADRFSSVSDFVEALTRRRPARVRTAAENPYRGLHAFEEADATHFHGRDRLRQELVESLATPGIRSRSAVLVGASGSGKSSVVRAGLIPALRLGAVETSEQWFITSMVPGDDPFGALADALSRVATSPVDDLERVLRSGRRGLLRSVRGAVDEGQIILLFIDQFEELFAADERESTLFLESLATAIEEPTSAVRLIATLRADFYDRPLSHRDFAAVLKQTAIDVTPLAADELEEAIVEPATAVGVTLEPGLLATIVADTIGEPAPLPLLQYALADLFDRRVDGVMTNAVYRDMGGLTGALAIRAEQLYDASSTSERDAIRHLFGRLTTSGGTADLRRRMPVAEIDGASPPSVLARFSDARLLTFDRDPETREPTVEIAHEALLTAWPRLGQWLRDDRDARRRAAEVAALADRWNGGGRQDSDVVRGGRLESAESLLATELARLRAVDVEFVTASTALAERERRADAARLRRLRALVGATGVALVVAVIAAAVAFGLRSRAEDATDDAVEQRNAAVAAEDEADLRTLISRSAAVAVDDPTTSVLLALEAHERSPGPETERVVLDALTRLGPIVATHDPVPLGDDECDNDGRVSVDGLVQYATIGGRMVEHDIDARSSRDLGSLADRCAGWLLTHDGERVVERNHETLWFSDFGSEDRVRVQVGEQFQYFHAIDAGPDRAVVATAETDRSEMTIQLFDTVSGSPVGDPIAGLARPGLASTPDGKTLVVSSGTVEAPDGGGPLILIDSETGVEQRRTTLPNRAQSFDFDTERNQVIMGTGGGLITVDLETGETVSQVDLGSLVDIRGVLLRPDDTVAVLTSGRLELVDRELGVLNGAGVELRNAAVGVLRPDGRILVHTEEHDNLVVDLDGGALVDQSVPTGRTAVWVEYAAGTVVSTDIGTHEVDVIDTKTGDRVRYQLTLPDGTPYEPIVAGPANDGNGDIVTYDATGLVGLWRDGVLQSSVYVPSSPDAALFTGAGAEGRTGLGVALSDGTRESILVRTVGEIEVLLRVDDIADVATVVPNGDAGLHVAVDQGRVISIDSDGARSSSADTGVCCINYARHDTVSGRVAFGGDRGFFVYDPDSGAVTVLDTTSSVSNVALVRDGRQLVVGRRDGTFQLWDVESSELVGVLHDGTANTLGTPTYEAETDSVWLAVPGRAIRVPLDPSIWVQRACGVVGRELTSEEWDEFVPGDGEQRPVCSGSTS